MTLTEFLLARIAEDEAMAQAAQVDSGLIDAAIRANRAAQGRAADVAFIARHDPARVLADCAANRRIVETVVEYVTEDAAAEILHALALPFADHPDYDEKWRP